MRRREFNTTIGFTLIELITVIVILGVLGTLGVVSYGRMLEQDRARQAVSALRMIHEAELGYRARNGAFWPALGETKNMTDINQALNLNLYAPEVVITCTGVAPGFTCQAVRNAGSAVYTFQIITSGTVTCSSGTCPSFI